MLSIPVSDVLERAAFFLNDVNRSYFTDTVLLDPFKVAYDDMRQLLMDNNMSILDSTTGIISIPAGTTDIGGPSGPPLPVDFMVPYALWERPAGTSNDFSLMEKRQFLPKTTIQVGYLGYWQYSKQYIHLLSADQDNEVKLDYIGNTLNFAETAADQINLFNAKTFLSYRTAALASEYLGENSERAVTLNGNAQRSLDEIINADVKSRQGIYTRRRPFNSSLRARSII